MFDAEALLNATTTNANSTEYEMLPEGTEFVGQIQRLPGKPAMHKFEKDGNTTWYFDMNLEASGPAVKAATGRDKTNVKYSIGLDITPMGTLASGKGENVRLGILREAAGQNADGMPFKLTDVFGKAVRFTVKHRMGEDGRKFQDVAKVLPL